RLYGDLLVGGFQRLRAAEDLPHLTQRAFSGFDRSLTGPVGGCARMITIRHERPVDEAAREALLDVAYGDERHGKPSAKLRRGRLPAENLSFVAVERGRIVGTVRLWDVAAGRRKALLLGPLAVHPDAQNRGIGGALMRRAMDEAGKRGHAAVLLV